MCICNLSYPARNAHAPYRHLWPAHLNNIMFTLSNKTLTNDGRCTCEIKSRIAMAKGAFNKKKILFTSKLDLNLRKKLVNATFGAWLCMVLKLGRSGSRSEIPGKF